MDREQVIKKIREFNRYYMSVLSLLDKSYLHSGYSVTEARILYELLENENCTANRLAQKLHIDKSYLSRILRKFEDKGMISKVLSREDTRKQILNLTSEGTETAQALVELSNRQISSIIQGLSDGDCETVCRSIDKLATILREER